MDETSIVGKSILANDASLSEFYKEFSNNNDSSSPEIMSVKDQIPNTDDLKPSSIANTTILNE